MKYASMAEKQKFFNKEDIKLDLAQIVIARTANGWYIRTIRGLIQTDPDYSNNRLRTELKLIELGGYP